MSSCPYFDQTLPYREIDVATFSFFKPLQLFLGGIKIAGGVQQSRKILREFKPDLVVGFGSFYTLPLLVAAKLEKIPFLLHEQNALPGKVNRLFSRFAVQTAITFPNSKHYLKGKTTPVAFPLRKNEGGGAWEYFGLEKKPTLLVFGGSQGARILNEEIFKLAPFLTQFQLLHFIGKQGEEVLFKKRYKELGISHVVKRFEKRFDLAMEVADFAICRGGASTIAELTKYELPAILIPFPYASEDHQVENSRYFVETIGGGKMLLESEIGALGKEIPLNLEKYRQNMRLYKGKHVFKEFAELIGAV